MKTLKRLKVSIWLPRNPHARTLLLAMRCGYCGSTAPLAGFDNRLTRWVWTRFVEFWPGEYERMVIFLKLIRDRIPKDQP